MDNIKELLKAKQATRDTFVKDVEEFEALLTDYFGEFLQNVDGNLTWIPGGKDEPNATVISFGHESFQSKNKGWVHQNLLTIDGRYNVYEPPYEGYRDYIMDNIDRRFLLDNAAEIVEAFKKQALAEYEKDASVRTKFDAFKKSVKGNKP